MSIYLNKYQIFIFIMKISLVTSFFFSPNIRRQKEYELTLHRNLEKDFISKIYLFITDNDHKNL